MSNKNPVLHTLTQLLLPAQKALQGGVRQLLQALCDTPIKEKESTALHFDKALIHQASGAASLTSDNQRQRVAQLNQFFKAQQSGLHLASRKYFYRLEFPESLADSAQDSAFKAHALQVAGDTDPAAYVEPEVTADPLLFVSHKWREGEIKEITREFIKRLIQDIQDKNTEDLTIQVFCDLSDHNPFRLDEDRLKQQDQQCEIAQVCLVLWNSGYDKSQDCRREMAYFIDDDGQNKPGKAAIGLLEQGTMPDLLTHKYQNLGNRILYSFEGNEASLEHFWPDAKPAQKTQYVSDLVKKIRASFLHLHPNQKGKPDKQKHDMVQGITSSNESSIIRGNIVDKCDGTEFQEPDAFDGHGSSAKRIKIIPYLTEWAQAMVTPSVPRNTVLLGDFGFGKTVTCRLLAEHLGKLYEANDTAILPIYLDLKALLGDLKDNLKQPVEYLLELMLSQTGAALFEGRKVLDFIRNNRCLVIFDGFDEIGHKLNKSQQQAMYHKLLNIIPTKVYANDARGSEHHKYDPLLATYPTKLLISCRTHFFHSISNETSFITGNDRHAVSSSNFKRFYMAPFTPNTVKNYLVDAMGSEAEGLSAWNMLDDIHDLSSLSSHPIMLRLISMFIPRLQLFQLDNKPVNSAVLYLQLFEDIGERDTDKHIIELSIKQTLLAQLAFKLWLEDKTDISFRLLKAWFIDFSDQDSLLRRQSSIDLDSFSLMLGDLCNATLLVRDNQDKYRFAHTSYLEFFRALGIFEFIRTGTIKNDPPGSAFSKLNKLPELNQETMQFLINWRLVCEPELRQEFDAEFIRLLESPLNSKHKWLSFYLWRFALEQLSPKQLSTKQLSPEQLNLPQLSQPDVGHFPHSTAPDWSGLQFGEDFIELRRIKHPAQPAEDVVIDLSKANFAACYFHQIQFAGLQLTQANFDDTRLYQCDFPAVLSNNKTHPLPPPQLKQARLTATHPPALSQALSKPPLDACSQEGHFGFILASSRSKDGKTLATAGRDRVIRIWDVANLNDHTTPQCRHQLQGHSGDISTLQFHPDGNTLASAGDDKSIRIWDVGNLNGNATPQCLHKLQGHSGWINTLQFHPDGNSLAAAGTDNAIRIWDVGNLYGNTTPQCLHQLQGHSGDIRTLQFHPDGNSLAAAGTDKSIRIWDVGNLNGNTTPQCLHQLQGHSGNIRTLQFHPDGNSLASAGDDESIRIWDVGNLNGNTTPQCLHQLQGHSGWISTLQFHPDGNSLAAAGFDESIRIWDVGNLNGNTTPQCLHQLLGHSGWIKTLQFHPDGNSLAAAGKDKSIRIWDVGNLNGNTTLQCLHKLQGHSGWIKTLQFHPDGNSLAAAGFDGSIRIWDVGNLNGNTTPQCLHKLQGHSGDISTLQFHPDGNSLAAAGFDESIRIWDVGNLNGNTTPQCLHKLLGHSGWINTLQFHPDGNSLAAAGKDESIRIWDVGNLNGNTTPQCLHKLQGHSGWISTLQFHPDGNSLAAAGFDGSIRIWDVGNLNGNTTPQCLHKLQGHSGTISTLQFHPDGNSLASAGFDGSIRIWDVNNGQCFKILSGIKTNILSLRFSLDGSLLYCAASDEIFVWDTRSYQCVQRIRELPNGYFVFAMSGEGACLREEKLLSATGDAWRYIVAKDDEGNGLPARAWQDWDKVYRL